jgi:membrane protease YdiL (CAAX protease family)
MWNFILLLLLPAIHLYVSNELMYEERFLIYKVELNGKNAFLLMIGIPIIEELIFRKIIPFILEFYGIPFSYIVIISSILFISIHTQYYYLFTIREYRYKIYAIFNIIKTFIIGVIYMHINNVFISSMFHIYNNVNSMYLQKYVYYKEYQESERKRDEELDIMIKKIMSMKKGETPDLFKLN